MRWCIERNIRFNLITVGCNKHAHSYSEEGEDIDVKVTELESEEINYKGTAEVSLLSSTVYKMFPFLDFSRHC